MTKLIKKKTETTETVEKKKFEQRDFSGALFENSRKEKETNPDYNGTVIIEGVEYWISAWDKTSAKGQPYLSLAFKAKE